MGKTASPKHPKEPTWTLKTPPTSPKTFGAQRINTMKIRIKGIKKVILYMRSIWLNKWIRSTDREKAQQKITPNNKRLTPINFPIYCRRLYLFKALTSSMWRWISTGRDWWRVLAPRDTTLRSKTLSVLTDSAIPDNKMFSEISIISSRRSLPILKIKFWKIASMKLIQEKSSTSRSNLKMKTRRIWLIYRR